MAFDTNGPIGECLFPQDSIGDIVFCDICECDYSEDSIKAFIEEWVYDLKQIKQYKIENYFKGITKIAFEVEIPVEKELLEVPIGTFKRDKSQVSFMCVFDIRNKKYRYTLNRFYTERRNIPGEGKSEGPSNMLHWQRVNSLSKELNNTKKDEERKALEQAISDEHAIYQAEYKAVHEFINSIKTITNYIDF